jgi:hypothetical protein
MRILLSHVVGRVCHPSLLTVNRYRFSASPDYFVPNKTLYSDYVAFIRQLPTEEVHYTVNCTAN